MMDKALFLFIVCNFAGNTQGGFTACSILPNKRLFLFSIRVGWFSFSRVRRLQTHQLYLPVKDFCHWKAKACESFQ
jgi:hypothetical protein